MYGSEISASCGSMRVVSSQTAGRPSGVSTRIERDVGNLAGRAGMVRRELAALLRLAEAAAAGGEDDRRRLELVLAAAGAPSVLASLEAGERAVREGRAGAGLPRIAERLRDCVTRAVADLEQPLARGAAAAGDAVAAVLARELDAELLQPGDRARRLGCQ